MKKRAEERKKLEASMAELEASNATNVAALEPPTESQRSEVPSAEQNKWPINGEPSDNVISF